MVFVYQLKFVIEKWLEENPDKVIKGWKSASKDKLLEILKNNKISMSKYNYPTKNPSPAPRAVGDVLKKYGRKKNTPEEQEATELNISSHKNPLHALQKYTNKEGKSEYINLEKHQRDLIKQFVYSNLRGCIAFHGVGSGKTLTAVVSSFLYLKMYPTHKVIVISPSALLFNFINGMIQYGLDIGDNRYSYYTYDKYIRKPQLAKDSLLIIDEAHNFRTEIITHQNENEETGELEIDINSNKRGYKIMEYGSKHAHKVLLLTGTAFVNSLYDIENLLSMVDNRPPIKREDFERVITDADNIQDYFNYKISYYKTSPTSIYFPTMNKAHEQIIPIYMTKEQEEEYNEIKQTGKPDTESTKPNNFYNAELYANNAIDKEDNPKIKWVIDKIKSEPKQKFIVYSTLYGSGVKLILSNLKKLNIEYTTITGKQSTSSKEENKRYFNGYNFGNDNFFNIDDVDVNLRKYINDKYRVLVITKAGAEGVDTINCQNVILLNSLWNDATSEQIIARAIRFKSHFGLPEKERYVNVYRLLLAKESNKEIVDILKNPNFKQYCNLKKELRDETLKQLNLSKADEGTYKPTVKELKELKKGSSNEPFIPDETKEKKVRSGFNKKSTIVRDGAEGWDKYKALKTNEEREKWRIRLYSQWYGQYGKGETDINPLRTGLSSCTADILMYVMAKAKSENIDSFCSLLGTDISLFEKYQSTILPYIMELEKKTKRELTEEEQAEIYAKIFRKVEQIILGTRYEPTPRQDRSKEEKLQEFFTNALLAKEILDKSSIKNRNDKITILEPTAGDGALIRPILELGKDATIDMVELNRLNRERLKELVNGQPALFLEKQPNFLKYEKSTRYDYIFMNPPFHLKRTENAGLLKDTWDFDFVKRAFAFLKVGGELIAITSQHYKSEESMVNWYENKHNKNVEIIVKKKEKFVSSTGKKAQLDICIIKITKTKTNEDSDILNIEFYKKSNPELGQQILNNEEPIVNVIKEQEPKQKPKEEPIKNIIVKKEIPKKKNYLIVEDEPKIEIPKPEPQPANIEPVVNKLEDKIKEFEQLGAKFGARDYDSSSFIQVVAYIALLLEYERKCAILTEDLQKIKINSKPKNITNTIFFNNAKNLSNDLLDCIKRGDKIIGIPLSLNFGTTKTGHANMLIYRPDDKTIERYEPHGSGFLSGGKDDDTFNKILKEMFEVKMKPYLKEYTPKFYTPAEICPNMKGFQTLENQIKGIKKEGGGFCGLWALFALELMFLNPTMKTTEILNLALNITNKDPQYIKNIIRGYVVKTEKLLDNYIKKIDKANSFNYAKGSKLISSQDKLQNNLLHLLVSWGSTSSNIEKINKINSFRDELKKHSASSLNKMAMSLLNQKFTDKFSHDDMIRIILHMVKSGKPPTFTEEAILKYFDNNKGSGICPKIGKCKKITKCGRVRI
jgi:tRNA1(Val) A37 N6-methylase TrmN6